MTDHRGGGEEGAFVENFKLRHVDSLLQNVTLCLFLHHFCFLGVRERERDRQTDRQTEKQKQKQIDRDRDTHTDTLREKRRETDRTAKWYKFISPVWLVFVFTVSDAQWL